MYQKYFQEYQNIFIKNFWSLAENLQTTAISVSTYVIKIQRNLWINMRIESRT